MQNARECQAQAHTLKGKIVLMRPARQLAIGDKPLFRRLTAEELAEEERLTGAETNPDVPAYLRRPPLPGAKPRMEAPNFAALAEGCRSLNACLSSAAVALAIYPKY